MKSFFPLLCCSLTLLSSLSLSAAEPTVDWVSGGGGKLSEKTRAICFDGAGNVFVAGEATGDGVYGEQMVKGAGGMDFVLAKLNAKGQFLWARSLGGSLVDRGYGVVADSSGNVCVTGHYQSTDAVVNGQTLPNAGDYDLFVAKYDGEGKVLWVRTAGGKGYDYGHGIALDSKGDVVVTGSVAGAALFGDTVLKGEGRAIFCAKYDAEGTLLWVKGTEGNASGSGHGIAVDGKDAIYIAGNVSGSGTMGGKAIHVPKGQATFLSKLSAEGTVEWIETTAGTPSAIWHEIAVDAEGRIWVAGMFKGSVTLGDASYQTTGDKDNDGLVAHYTGQGKVLWSLVLQGPLVDYCLGVATDGKGTGFVTGEFSDKAMFAGQALASQGATDIFVAALDEKGAVQWCVPLGGVKGDNAYTMAYQKGHLVIGGASVAPATFGGKELKTSGGADLYGVQMTVE